MDSENDWQQRALDNERLRRLATAELESTRDQLADTVQRLQKARADLIKCNELLVAAVAEHEVLHQDKAAVIAELAEANAIIGRQKAHIERLKQQLARPLRQVAKKAVRTLRPGSSR